MIYRKYVSPSSKALLQGLKAYNLLTVSEQFLWICWELRNTVISYSNRLLRQPQRSQTLFETTFILYCQTTSLWKWLSSFYALQFLIYGSSQVTKELAVCPGNLPSPQRCATLSSLSVSFRWETMVPFYLPSCPVIYFLPSYWTFLTACRITEP